MTIFSTGDETPSFSPGFSLMEMLLVVALFSIVVVIMAQTFSSFNQLHRKIANRAVVSSDLRFTTELLVRAIRNRPVSYSIPPLLRDSSVRLDQANGETMIIRRSDPGDAACNDLATVSCLLLSVNGGASWASITGRRLHVERFDVYVRPTQSPFNLVGGNYPNNTQPFVTFNLRLRYMADNSKEREVLETQTTVASRVYQR